MENKNNPEHKHDFFRTTKDYKPAYKCFECAVIISVDEYKKLKNGKRH